MAPSSSPTRLQASTWFPKVITASSPKGRGDVRTLQYWSKVAVPSMDGWLIRRVR